MASSFAQPSLSPAQRKCVLRVSVWLLHGKEEKIRLKLYASHIDSTMSFSHVAI